MTRARRAVAWAIATAAAAAGCKDKAKPRPAPPDPAPVIDARAVVSPEVAGLPGALWFVDDGPPEKVWRLAGGQRTELGADLYPSAHRLGDGRQVAIWSLGNGEPGSEQIALIAPDGAIARIGTAATQVRDPAVDPAGKWVVVAANLDGHSDLYRIDLAKPDTQTRITSNPEGNFHPTALGPDAIAFASSRDGDSEIYRADVRGKAVQRLTAFHRDDWDPIASPDGRTIAFLSDREGPPRIFLMAADGTGQRRLTGRADDGLDETDPAWSADGTRIAYITTRGDDRRLVVHELATRTETTPTPDGARDGEPSFAPDSAWVVVARATVRGDGEDHELWAIPIAGGAALQLTAGGGAEGLPRWTK